MTKESRAIHLSGKVAAINLSPDAVADGALVQTSDGIVQVNFPKHGGHALRREMELKRSSMALNAIERSAPRES